MSIIDYRLVYRDGADTGAPVNKLVVLDSDAELPFSSNNSGDLGFAKDKRGLYYWTGFTWNRITSTDWTAQNIGTWIDVPFDSNFFAPYAPMTINITAQRAFRYRRIENGVDIQLWIESTLGGSPSGGINIYLPAFLVSAGYSSGVGRVLTSIPAIVYTVPGVNYMTVIRTDTLAYSLGDNQMLLSISIVV